MNRTQKLLSSISLVALSVGMLIPTPIAQAASPASEKSIVEQETLKHSDSIHEDKHQSISTNSPESLSRRDKKNDFYVILGLLVSSVFLPELFKESKNESTESNKKLESDKATIKNKNFVPQKYVNKHLDEYIVLNPKSTLNYE